MGKNYKLRQTGEQVQEILDRAESQVLSGPTAFWEAQTQFIPEEGQIIIYTDYQTETVSGTTVNIPGVKIGTSSEYVNDLPFIDDYDQIQIQQIINQTYTKSEVDTLIENIKPGDFSVDGTKLVIVSTKITVDGTRLIL